MMEYWNDGILGEKIQQLGVAQAFLDAVALAEVAAP